VAHVSWVTLARTGGAPAQRCISANHCSRLWHHIGEMSGARTGILAQGSLWHQGSRELAPSPQLVGGKCVPLTTIDLQSRPEVIGRAWTSMPYLHCMPPKCSSHNKSTTYVCSNNIRGCLLSLANWTYFFHTLIELIGINSQKYTTLARQTRVVSFNLFVATLSWNPCINELCKFVHVFSPALITTHLLTLLNSSRLTPLRTVQYFFFPIVHTH
jgi:hypothetical protein